LHVHKINLFNKYFTWSITPAIAGLDLYSKKKKIIESNVIPDLSYDEPAVVLITYSIGKKEMGSIF